MADHLTRGELKRNEIGEALEAGVDFLETHVRTILIGAGAIVVLAIAVWGVVHWQRSRDARANDLLGAALRVATAPVEPTGARPEDSVRPSFPTAAARDARARELFEALVDEHGKRAAGAAARLWLADAALAAGDRSGARRHWEESLRLGKRSAFALAAQRNLWAIDRSEGRGESAQAEIAAALDRRERRFPPDFLLRELAETQAALGRTSDARASWRRLVDEYPTSPFAAQARQELAEGGSAP
jgi:tetratricopeptide (TPR) repeat protein